MPVGWIKLHRKIRDHWLYRENRKFSRYEAWIDLLMMASFTDSKFCMDGQFVEVKRGGIVTSIEKLRHQWGWSNNKVKGFLNALQKDGMITYKCDNKKTCINIVNYCLYQDDGDNKNTSERHGKNMGCIPDAYHMHTL